MNKYDGTAMNMRKFKIAVALLVGVSCFLSTAAADPGAIGPDPKTVSVLYAGKPESWRMERTQIFLKAFFGKVHVHDLSADTAIDTSEYDVVVIDWAADVSQQWGQEQYRRLKDKPVQRDILRRSLRELRVLGIPSRRNTTNITRTAKPMVILGIAGMAVSELEDAYPHASHMGDYACDTKTDHPIFKGPLPVDVQWESIKKPINFFLHSGSNHIEESMQGWRVQVQTENDPRFGFCCDQSYLANTPNAESISCGTADAPNSATIFRLGNCLVWGFACSPHDMTAAGQAAFINSICYMKAFDKQSAGPVRQVVDKRREFVDSLYFFRTASYPYTAANQKYMEDFGASALDNIDSPAKLVENPEAEAKAIQQKQQEDVKIAIKSLPRDVRDQFPDDPLEIIDYYEKNIEYLHRDAKGRYVVDEDVQSLSMSNRTSDFLKKCIDLLGDSAHATVASELLERYTGQPSQTAEQWRAWYDTEGKNWVFDESQSKFQPSSQVDH